MSNYQDIYRDLPSRVNEVWYRIKEIQEKEEKDLSVTAMLMAAATGLAMPLEDIHITQRRRPRPNHVMIDANENIKYQTAIKKFKDFLDEDLNKCEIFTNSKFSRCAKFSEIRNIGEYGGDDAVELGKYKVGFAISIIRNALAHNNIMAFGMTMEKIEKITFFSENWIKVPKRKLNGWNLITMQTHEFNNLLERWFELIDKSTA